MNENVRDKERKKWRIHQVNKKKRKFKWGTNKKRPIEGKYIDWLITTLITHAPPTEKKMWPSMKKCDRPKKMNTSESMCYFIFLCLNLCTALYLNACLWVCTRISRLLCMGEDVLLPVDVCICASVSLFICVFLLHRASRYGGSNICFKSYKAETVMICLTCFMARKS